MIFRVLAIVAALAVCLGACGSAASPSAAPSAAPTSVVSPSESVEPSESLEPSEEPTESVEPSESPSSEPSTSSGPSAPASAGSGPSTPPDNVRVALDWTPNTDHSGFYVASAKGWYADAGIHVQLLPYNQTAPESLIAAGQTECGISFQDAMTFAYAAGAPITSVMAILQHNASAIAVLGDGPIKRPRDLDGKTYAGFGYPADHPTIQVIIKHDGGKGDFKEATLNTSAYAALYSKAADFTIVFTAWEGIEAKERGIDLRYFRPVDYGFPDYYQVVLACDSRWLAAKPDVARRFIDATVQGFQFANDHPAETAAILISSNPGIFEANPKLPLDSANYLSQQKLYVNDAGLVGPQTIDQWTAYSSFLYREGLLSDGNGKPLTSPPDYSKLFTNDFLPGGP